MPHFRPALFLLRVCCTAFALAATAHGQDFPARQVHLVVPYPPGGSIDLLARAVAPSVERAFGQSVVVENRAGAAGEIGMNYVARSTPDGYTVALSSPGPVVINSHMRKQPYDAVNGLAPVATVATVPLALAVRASLPAKTLRDFMDYARQGGNIRYSVSGAGAQTHLSGELMKAMGHFDMLAIPYQGTQPATTALLGGQVDATISDLTTLQKWAAEGKVRLLAVLDAERTRIAPDLPTVAEAGIPGFSSEAWTMLFGPAGMNADALRKWQTAIADALKDPAVAKRILDIGMVPMITPSSAVAGFFRNENAKWAEAVRLSGMAGK